MSIDPEPTMQGADRGGPFLQRIGNARTWSDPDKCLLVAAVSLALTLSYSALLLYSGAHPSFEPYVDQAALRLLLRFQFVSAAAWTSIAIAALLLRRRRRAPLLVGAATAYMSVHLLYSGYFFGFLTHPFYTLSLTTCWVGALIFFDRRLIAAAWMCQWIALLGITIAAQYGLLPYAPLYRDWPVHDGHLLVSWLTGQGALTLAVAVFVQFILYALIARWHDREQALAVTSEQLARANDVISRYVASQLAEQVRAGDHAAMERHARRRLTLFFSDIEGFAATADSMEPEDLSGVLNEYLSEMTAIAERHGATIDKFVGDAIMIFFGAPVVSGEREQALQAARMAIEMQGRLDELREAWAARGMERPFHVRMGINSGHATVGAFGSRSRLEYTAIGRQVNLAARLQAQCERDRILVSHSTWALINQEIACSPKGEMLVKGFHQPVKVYEVVPPASGHASEPAEPPRRTSAE